MTQGLPCKLGLGVGMKALLVLVMVISPSILGCFG